MDEARRLIPSVAERPIDLVLPDADATTRLGAALARSLRAPVVIWLEGELGAGKTTLARGTIQSFDASLRVRSPTYTLMETYALPDFILHHLDLYRIRDPEELDALALRETAGHVLMIEWPGQGGVATPPADIDIEMRHRADESREVSLRSRTPVGQEILNELQRVLQDGDYKLAAGDGFPTKKT